MLENDDGIGWDIFIKMELLTPLAKAVPSDNPEKMVEKLAKDMCAALEVCRKQGIVHRDIKPQNIFVSPNGDYKLGDFGIAKTVEKTMGGTKIGTYKFMAPEVYNNQPYGTAADVYSLGLVLYWLLNDRRMPFLPLPPEKPSTSMEEAARARRFSGEPLPPPVHGSENLKKIVLKACAYDPKDRYASAEEMLAELKESDLEGEKQRKVADEAERRSREQAEHERMRREQEERERLRREQETQEHHHNEQENLLDQNADFEEDAVQDNTKRILGVLQIITCICLSIATVLVFCYFNVHFWTEATCTEDSVCKLCEKTQTAALGHKWVEATCESPKYCSVCAQTSGNELGHTWLDATCTTAKTCSVCGKTEGNATGHDWTDATFTSPKTCAICGATSGDVKTKIVKIIADQYGIGLIKEDGTVEMGGNYRWNATVEKWSSTGSTVDVVFSYDFAARLLEDGTVQVEASGDEISPDQVSQWTDVIQLEENCGVLFGLKKDGTVMASKEITNVSGKNHFSQVKSWKDIVYICAGREHLAGLTADGQVLVDGNLGSCINVSSWKNIKAICTPAFGVLGLTQDGKVLYSNPDPEAYYTFDTTTWSGIVAICAGREHVVGLKSDGTVVVSGIGASGQHNVSEWTNIVAIAAADWYTVGLTADGEILIAGDQYKYSN